MNPFLWFCPILGLIDRFFDFPTRWWHCLEYDQRDQPRVFNAPRRTHP